MNRGRIIRRSAAVSRRYARISRTIFAGSTPAPSLADSLPDVTGILSYGFNSYEVLVTEAVTVVADVERFLRGEPLRHEIDPSTAANLA